MAMAARLSLRMQKELKLLLIDPPPGASFPSLSDDFSLSSLASVDALLQGPHGTVYATGVFKIKIQIPERYPFQPPVVTFATPIYHPNIDNGGRICLDILNLPPKGTWQPSLNISTVLASIGLLLSEPNPDDGLMHEASREYKYNRLAFDQNARTMTEKYARVTESGSSSASPDNQTHTGPSTTQTETQGSDASTCTERIVRFKGSGSKLSLGSLQSSSSNIYSESPGKSKALRNKMSLPVPLSRNGTSLNSHCTSILDTKTTTNDTQESIPASNIGADYAKSSHLSVPKEWQSLPYGKPGPHRNPDEKLLSVIRNEVLPRPLYKTNCPGEVDIGSWSTSVGLDMVLYSGPLGLPQCHFEGEKENLTPDPLTDQPAGMNHLGSSNDNSENQSGTLSKFLHVKDDIPEDVIVLDSEDEKVAMRSKLSLSRRCLPRKRKGNLAFYR